MRRPPSSPVLIRGATVLTGTGERIEQGDVLIANGRIEAMGRNVQAPANVRVIDAQGRWVTPGLIDVHSHLGVAASPGVLAQNDVNETTGPVTANVWAEHSIWPQDPGFQTALEGGITTLQILPGSANLWWRKGCAAHCGRTGGGGSHGARKNRQLAGNAVAHGLPWDAGLAALTANPAEIFGMSATRGRIAVGQVADVVLWSADPLEVTTLADQVWIAGRPVDMRSRQTELRDRYLERLKKN